MRGTAAEAVDILQRLSRDPLTCEDAVRIKLLEPVGNRTGRAQDRRADNSGTSGLAGPGGAPGRLRARRRDCAISLSIIRLKAYATNPNSG